MIEYRKIQFGTSNEVKRQLRNFSRRPINYSVATSEDYVKPTSVASSFAPVIKRLARIITLNRATSGRQAQLSQMARKIVDGATRTAFYTLFESFCSKHRINPTEAASLIVSQNQELVEALAHEGGDFEELTEEEIENILGEEEDVTNADKLDLAYKAYEDALIWTRSFFNFMFSSVLAMQIKRVLSAKFGRNKSLNMTFADKVPLKPIFMTIRNVVRVTFTRLGYKDEIDAITQGSALPEEGGRRAEGTTLNVYNYLAAQAVMSMFGNVSTKNLSSFGVNYRLFINGHYLVTRVTDSLVTKISNGVLLELASEATPSESPKVVFKINYMKVRPSRRAYSIANKVIGNMRHFSGSKKERLVKALLREFRKYFSNQEMKELEEEVTVTINKADAYQLISSLSELTAKLSEMLLGEVERAERQAVDSEDYYDYDEDADGDGDLDEDEGDEDPDGEGDLDEDNDDDDDTEDDDSEGDSDRKRFYHRKYFSRKRKALRKVKTNRKVVPKRKRSDMNRNANFFDLEEVRRKIYR
ncbi:MAG: hypothetical protein QXF12_07565 [Candidatus Aenigmatarchaeota archaeon]